MRQASHIKGYNLRNLKKNIHINPNRNDVIKSKNNETENQSKPQEMKKTKNVFFEDTNIKQIYGKINLWRRAQVFNIRNKKGETTESAEI